MDKSTKKQKKALIVGISGQDGSYLTELLLRKNYRVHGIVRRSSSLNTPRLDHIYSNALTRNPNFDLDYGDLTDTNSIYKILEKVQPDEVYNLGAQSHVRISFEIPEYTVDTVGLGTLRILEAIRDLGLKTKFYQASSSEMFGSAPAPQNENTPFKPRSPYGAAKVLAHHLTVNYRDAYRMFACSGILFNHESPRRGENFVTRKITRGIVNILAKKENKLYLGNLDAKRDWGFAKEYVTAMWLMLQQDKPDDYVIATGETHTVKEFVELAFEMVGLNWKSYIKIDPQYFRPTEVDVLLGDANKAKSKLGWEPKVKFRELVAIMLNADLKNAGLDLRVGKGYVNEVNEKEESIAIL